MTSASPRWAGLPVLVVGLGVSGAAAARALARAGADVCAVDSADSEGLRERAAALAAEGVDARVGALDADLLVGRRLVVPSPGVPQGHPLLVSALDAGISVWSEPELAWRLSGGRARLVAVTGTNGKTTTTQLLSDCLGAPAAGNIGTALVELLAADRPPPLVVAELSSFQLRFTHALRAAVGVVLNVAGDHLDWHGTADSYDAAKARVWANQRPVGGGGRDGGDWAVVNADDPGARRVAARHPPPARTAAFSLAEPVAGQVGIVDGRIVARLTGASPTDVVGVEELALRGRHNLENVCAAVAAAACAGADPAALARPLRAFTPGPHRVEHVATVGGVIWVNDSKATNPHAAAAALTSVADPPVAAADSGRRPAAKARPSVVWIAGGLDKALDFTTLRDAVRGRVRAALTIGASGPTIAAFTRSLGVPTVEAGELDAAVRAAADLAVPGDTVLLAPACASMDQFRDYAERGRAFRAAVTAVTGARPPPGAPAQSSSSAAADPDRPGGARGH